MKKVFQLFLFLLGSAGTLTAQWTQVTGIPIPATINGMDIDGSALYAATSSGNGLYKSVNNGASWTKLGLGDDIILPASDILPPKVQASGSTVVVYSQWDNSFYYSTNGGASFQQGGTVDGSVSSFLVQGNKVFALANGGLFLSTDYGATFTNTNVVGPGLSFGQIVQTPVGKILVYSTYTFDPFEVIRKVYRSTDDVNWTEITGAGGSNPLPTPQNGGFITYSSAGYANGAILVGMTNYDSEGALYKSSDLGANWYPVASDLFVNWVDFQISNGSRAIVLTLSGTGELVTYISGDLVTWSDISNQVQFALDGSGTKFVGVNAQGQIVISTNNGASWQPATGLIPGNDVVSRYLVDGNKKFVATMNNGLYRSTGNSGGWTKVLGNGVNGGDNQVWGLLKKGNTLLAAIGNTVGKSGIYRSTNNGNSWTRTHTIMGQCLFDDGNAVFAGDFEGNILKSTNSGQTWTAMNNGLPSGASPFAIIRSGNKLVVGLYQGIYRSSNNGASWSQVSAQIGVYCFVKSGSKLFAGTNAGLMKSTDNGGTWAFVQNDVTGSRVTALYVEGNELYIGTLDQGMYRSCDDGETLEPYNDGAGDNVFVSFIGREGNKLYAGWNNTDGYNSYQVPAYYGRLLWSENECNLHPSADDRAGAAPAKPGLAIFPNPVQDVLQFSSNVEPTQVAGIQLINVKGETVRDLSGENLLRTSVDVQDLPNGPYFFRLTMQDGTSLTRRFMVQRGH